MKVKEEFGSSMQGLLNSINISDEDCREQVKKHLTSLINQTRRKEVSPHLLYLLLEVRDNIK